VARAVGGGDSVGGLLARAGAATTYEEVAALVAEVKQADAEMRASVLDALSRNPGLEVASQALVVPALPNSARRSMMERTYQYPPATLAMLVLTGAADRPTGVVAEMVVENLHLVQPHRTWRVLEAVLCEELTDELVAALPCAAVHQLVVRTGAGTEARTRLGRYLAVALEGAPATVWTQFHQLAPEFSGTVGQLLAVCRATSAA